MDIASIESRASRPDGQWHRLHQSANRSPSLLLGMLATSLIAGLLCMDILVVACGLVATCVVALLRKEDGSLTILFCLGYQWLFIASGVMYRAIYGRYPSDHFSEHINTGVALLLSAFLMMAVGIWAGLRIWSHRPGWQRARSRLSEKPNYAIGKLFAWVIALYTPSWISTANPMQLAYSVSQILYRLLEFRGLFLFALFLTVLRRRQGRILATVAGLFVMLPMVTGGGSGFASVLIILLLSALTHRRALLHEHSRWPRNRRAFLLIAGSAFTLANLAIMWQGTIKSDWRPIATRGDLDASRIGRIRMFFQTAANSLTKLDWNKGVASLAQRTSDGPMLMALVAERVPEQVSHEHGALTKRALKHIAMPRLLFPDKENLGSDSFLVKKYAGLHVADEAQATSIGLGYLIEFYIDYGTGGMLIAAFVFGFFIASLHRILLYVAPSMDLYQGAAAAILLQHFFTLDANLAKVVGGLVMSYAVFGALFLCFGVKLHRSLLVRRHR